METTLSDVKAARTTSTKPSFETIKSFTDVEQSEIGVDTVQFLEAVDGLVKMFELLGIGVFTFVLMDLRGNINGIRAACGIADPEVSLTLEQLVLSEASQSKRDKDKHATGCLRRLTRGLLLTSTALKDSRDRPNASLEESFRRAYDVVLRHHHSGFVQGIVSLALRATPYKDDFYRRISQGADRDKFDRELDDWLGALDTIAKRISAFYKDNNLGDV